MHVLVTGGHGFIGSRVVRDLVARHTVRCLVRETSKTPRIDDLTWEKAIGDIRDADAVTKAMQGCDACIHLASVSSWEAMKTGAVEATIHEGTRNVLDAAKAAGAKRVVFVSSAAAVNGSRAPRIFNETTPFSLSGQGLVYAEAKYRAEQDASAVAERAGIELVIVNPAEVYGAHDDAFVTAGNLRDILRDWPAIACRGGTSIAHVDDVGNGIVKALELGKAGERYILGGENLSIEELVRTTLSIAGQKKPVIVVPNRLLKGAIHAMTRFGLPTPVIPEVLDYATLYWFMDSSKASDELGYRSRPARRALASAIEWLANAGHVKDVNASSVSAALRD
jgi:dihydroflavonol-4-reductase